MQPIRGQMNGDGCPSLFFSFSLSVFRLGLWCLGGGGGDISGLILVLACGYLYFKSGASSACLALGSCETGHEMDIFSLFFFFEVIRNRLRKRGEENNPPNYHGYQRNVS